MLDMRAETQQKKLTAALGEVLHGLTCQREVWELVRKHAPLALEPEEVTRFTAGNIIAYENLYTKILPFLALALMIFDI